MINKPILIINRPIYNEKDDAFHLNVQAQELEKAVNAGANFIGIISNYGGGKSSVVQAFSRQGKYQFCNICLWGDIKSQVNNEMDRMHSINHSFLYQLSKTIGSERFSRHINRIISKNYQTVSWSDDLSTGQIFLIAFFFLIYILLVTVEKICSQNDPVLLECVETFKRICYFKDIFFCLAIAISIYICKDNCITFSWKDAKINPIFSEADCFEVFEKIIHKARNKRYLISIEDLDRINSKEYMCDFLKMLYKYNELLTDKEKRKFIFCVSISEKIYAEMGDDAERQIYNKIFDYILLLRPIYQKKRKDFLAQIINKPSEIEQQSWEDALIWFSKGKNVGIREMKMRLNKAMAIWEELKSIKDEKQLNTNINFEICAIVSYFENTYTRDMHKLIFENEILHEIIEKQESGIAEEVLLRKLFQHNKITNKEFKKEFYNMFQEKKLCEEDFVLYFYRSPKKKE